MSFRIKESVNKLYSKFNEFKKNGFEKVYQFFQKNTSCETQSNEDTIVEQDILEYYSDISEDKYYSDHNDNIRRCNSVPKIESLYYDESGCPFDSFNLANWDGDQQVGFRE